MLILRNCTEAMGWVRGVVVCSSKKFASARMCFSVSNQPVFTVLHVFWPLIQPDTNRAKIKPINLIQPNTSNNFTPI